MRIESFHRTSGVFFAFSVIDRSNSAHDTTHAIHPIHMSLSRSLRSLGFPIPLEPPRTKSRPLSPPFQQAMPRHTHTKPPKDHTHSTLSSLSTLSSRRAARGRRVRRGTRYGPPRCCVVPITSARLLTAESARAPPPSAPHPPSAPQADHQPPLSAPLC